MHPEIQKFIKEGTGHIMELEIPSSQNILYELQKTRNIFRILLNAFTLKVSGCLPLRAKNIFIRRCFGMKIGRNVGIAPGVFFDVLYPELITIQDNAIIGYKVNVLCHEAIQHKLRIGRVVIKDNAVIGAFSTIRSGVTVGKNSIVAMNSFVNKDIPDNELWGGVPARKIKNLIPE